MYHNGFICVEVKCDIGRKVPKSSVLCGKSDAVIPTNKLRSGKAHGECQAGKTG